MGYKWKPIEPLSEQDRGVDLVDIASLYSNWKASRARLESMHPHALQEFNQRLIRRLSIETGVIERLYDVDDGTTETLVKHGFAEDYISHTSTNIEPAQLVDILRDQQAAIDLIVTAVKDQRQLTKGMLHELQAVLTSHQKTTEAVDSLGNRVEVSLRRGAFKLLTNNPRTSDGSMHEYCPPVNVDLEIERLMQFLEEYSQEDPILVAAWLQHRFTQIHPYQDGNGRVSRALVTLVLLKAKLLPIVVDRKERPHYLECLRLADDGDLSHLAKFFARLERTAILSALNVGEVEDSRRVSDLVIDSLREKLEKRKEKKHDELRRVNAVAVELRAMAAQLILRPLERLRSSLEVMDKAQSRIEELGSDKKSGHWYRYEVGRSARNNGRYANLLENHYLLKASVKVNGERLVFLVSFHHSGRELSGIMEVSAFAKIEFSNNDDKERASEEFVICSSDPFVITHTTDAKGIAPGFEEWLDSGFTVAVKEFGDRL